MAGMKDDDDLLMESGGVDSSFPLNVANLSVIRARSEVEKVLAWMNGWTIVR